MAKKNTKANIILVLALVVMFGARLLPGAGGLSADAVAVLGVFFGSLIMWIGISIDWPSMITLLALGLLPVFGFGPTFVGAFGNTTVAFLIFTFMLVYLFAAVTFMGLFISPSVLFVAFMPFLEDIFQVLEVKKGGKTGNLMMMGTAFCISLSSGMTAIGHVWPTMAIGYYTAATGKDVNQFQYMAMGIPAGILLIILLILVFRFIYRPDDVNDICPEKAMSLRGTVPAADKKEKIILSVMLLTVLLWVAPSLVKGVLPDLYATVNGWSTAMPPLLGCVLLFIFQVDGERIMNFKEVTSKGVLWGSILMTAAATQLGSCLTNEEIGISSWLTSVLEPLTGNLPVIGLILFFMTWAVVETNFF